MGTNCRIYYNIDFAYLVFNINNVARTHSEEIKDLLYLPENIKFINKYGFWFHGVVLSSSWRPTNNMFYLSIDDNSVCTIRLNNDVTDGNIVGMVYIPRQWLIIS